MDSYLCNVVLEDQDGALDWAHALTLTRALATSFRLSGSIGLNFTFGSIYNSIVNPRLDEIGG